MTKKTLKHTTIKRKVLTIKGLIKHKVNLADPDSFVMFLNTCDWASGTKDIAVDSYRDYLDMIGLTQVKLPHIEREDKFPFVPYETEIDAIIHALRTKISAFLRLLKDTGVRPIEAWSIKWLDIELPNKCVTIQGVKYSKSRKLKVTEQTLNMLFSLSKRNPYVFSSSGNKDRLGIEIEYFSRNFCKSRKRLAEKLKNPRIQLVTFRSD
jgi:integrase